MNTDLPRSRTLRVLAVASLVALTTCGDYATPTSPGSRSAPFPAAAAQASVAITRTLLTSGNNPANLKVYTTEAISPAPGALVLLAVMGHRSYGANPSPVVTGGGMASWEEVATVTFDPVAAPLKRVTLYRAMSTAPGSGPITITFAGSVSNAQWIASQWEGVDVSGANGAGAIVQAGSTSADAASGLTVTLAPFASANNSAYGVFGVRSSVGAVTPGSGFTEIAEVSSAESPASGLEAEWATSDHTIDASWVNLHGAALGVEIKAAASPVASVLVRPAEAGVGTGSTLQLSATPRDAAENPLPGRTVTWWTSDAAVATVSDAGLVAGISQGTVTITAASEGQSGAATVTVGAPMASVDLAPASVDLRAGATVQLSATARDAAGNPLSGRVVTWTSSDDAVATVSATGLVTGIAIGSATITATSEGERGTSTVTVIPAPVATVEVSPATTSVPAKATTQLIATLRDAEGNVLSGRTVTWSSDDVAVATVNGSGLVTGVATGSATLTATSEGASGSAAVTVTPAAVASVEVIPSTSSAPLGTRVQLTATPKGVDGEPLSGREVIWSTSARAVASVSATGLVTALWEGSATITASVEGHTDAAAITVTPPPPGSPAMMVTAGDIALCDALNDEATALLLDELPGTVLLAGDNVYDDGSAADFANCYEPSWGRHKVRTRPAAGNHEYETPNAAGYFDYFGAAAGDPTKGYYSYDAGAWHVVVLNSNIPFIAGSPQEQWLRADLAASTKACQMAVWHHPRFTTNAGRNTDGPLKALWDALYAAGADLIINGHDHNYQRFAPQTPAGVRDDVHGIRQITVGTGGASLAGAFGTQASNIEARNGATYGVLQLTLRSDGYDWRFVPVAGQTFTDQGTGTCHDAPPNQAPTARVGGPYRSEGVVALNGSASTDPDGHALTYRWNFGDGTTGTGANPSHDYTADGVYTVTLVVTDALGATSAPATTTATIANIAPTVSAGPDVFVPEGHSFSLSGTFGDQGGNDGPWTYTIDWGDGATSEGDAETQSAPIIRNHVYAAAGTYPVRVTVTDKDGGSGSDALTVTVTESAPAAIAPTLLTFANNAVNQKVYATASISPAPNALVLLAVMGHRSSGANPSPIVTGGGMTAWEEVATVTFDPLGAPLKRVTLYRAMSMAPGSGPITITFANAVSNAQWIVTQWEGVDVSGTNGAGAIVQSGTARADAVSGMSVALASFASASNAAYGVFGVRSSVAAVTPGSGFAEIAEVASAESPASGLQTQWGINSRVVAATWAAMSGAALAVEIRTR